MPHRGVLTSAESVGASATEIILAVALAPRVLYLPLHGRQRGICVLDGVGGRLDIWRR
jgi:hypothetical protein